MTPDTEDTIVAIATAHGAGRRGVVRVSGPDAVAIVASLYDEPIAVSAPRRLAGAHLRVSLGGEHRSLPADLFVWPDRRSYTQQPSVEIHTIGSPPLLEALVKACRESGARLAEPGEFTLRAFLAGRLDLTQAEAVLGVIDARDRDHLGPALEQLAGGLSTPLHHLRAELLGLLADLEAGLDFVEEADVRFVEPEELRNRLAEAADLVAATARQMTERDTASCLPRVALVGAPNVGKSRLFNALVERFGIDASPTEALVADVAGVTRDLLVAVVRLGESQLELIDTAGDDESASIDAIDAVARGNVESVRRDADLLVDCQPATASELRSGPAEAISVMTMSDCADASCLPEAIATSAVEGT
ncbi:MAG: GTPase, partial [Planctomycetota bacterium]